jgi:hypothetical protein
VKCKSTFALPYLMTSSAEVTMQATAFETVDVFTTQRFGGNQLAEIADARGLSGEQMRLIASEFNESETAFVHRRRIPIIALGRESLRQPMSLRSQGIQTSGRPLYSADKRTSLANRSTSQCVLNKGRVS